VKRIWVMFFFASSLYASHDVPLHGKRPRNQSIWFFFSAQQKAQYQAHLDQMKKLRPRHISLSKHWALVAPAPAVAKKYEAPASIDDSELADDFVVVKAACAAQGTHEKTTSSVPKLPPIKGVKRATG
jgi:hypothetical protein